jgi:Asp-tRNA(Asn)/Glu-tRNA(Gln) amidotransferase A subunit family amidase
MIQCRHLFDLGEMWRQPRKVGDLQSTTGDNSQILSPQIGSPAITVPIAFTSSSLMASLTLPDRALDKTDLIRFVLAYEQSAKHRRAPEKSLRLKEGGQ